MNALHHGSGTVGGIIRPFTASSLYFSSKEPQPDRRTDQVGVSTYLALTFGTLLSSQGTDTSFVLTLSGFPPGASLRSCVSDSIRSFRSDFLGAFQVNAFAFPFPAVPTLSEASGRTDRPLISEISGRLLWKLVFREAGGLSTVTGSGSPRLQATVRIYLPTRPVSTVFVGRRGD